MSFVIGGFVAAIPSGTLGNLAKDVGVMLDQPYGSHPTFKKRISSIQSELRSLPIPVSCCFYGGALLG